MTPAADRILVLGLGNDILTDDAVGLRVVRGLRAELPADSRCDIRETQEMGLALLDWIVGYGEIIIVDAIRTGTRPPGTLRELDPAGLEGLAGPTPHFLGVGDTLALGRRLGLPMPARVRILAIEVDDPYTLGTQMTPALEAALPDLVARVHSALAERVCHR